MLLKTGVAKLTSWDWPFLALLGLGSGLRLFWLDNQSLWYDELFQRWVARFSLPQLFEQVAADGQTPPLSYLVTYGWSRLLDWLWPGLLSAHPEFFLRLPSVIFSILLLLVIYRLGYRLFGRGVALMALGLCAINPLLVDYGQEARAYSLALLLVALSFLIFLQLQTIPGFERAWLFKRVRRMQLAPTNDCYPLTPTSWHLWLLYIIISVAAIYTHYYTAYALLAQSGFFLAGWWSRRNRLELARWVGIQMIIGLSFLPWFFVWLGVVGHTSSQLTLPPNEPLSLARSSIGWLGLGNVEISPRFAFNQANDWPATLLFVSGLLVVGLGTWLSLSQKKGYQWAVVLIWFVCATFGPVAGGQIVRLATSPRYAIQGAPPLMLLLAITLNLILTNNRNTLPKALKSLWERASARDFPGATTNCERKLAPTDGNLNSNIYLNRVKFNRQSSIVNRQFRRAVGRTVAALWIGLMLWGLGNYYFGADYARSDWRGVIITVKNEAQAGDVLLGFPYHHFEVAQDLYLHGSEWPMGAGGWSYEKSGALYFPGQRWGGYADFNQPQTAPSPDLTSDLARLVQPYRRVWLVAYNDPTNAIVLDWLKAHYRAVAPRYFGPHQSLVLYQFEPLLSS